jgi:hypothetical protein
MKQLIIGLEKGPHYVEVQGAFVLSGHPCYYQQSHFLHYMDSPAVPLRNDINSIFIMIQVKFRW